MEAGGAGAPAGPINGFDRPAGIAGQLSTHLAEAEAAGVSIRNLMRCHRPQETVVRTAWPVTPSSTAICSSWKGRFPTNSRPFFLSTTCSPTTSTKVRALLTRLTCGVEAGWSVGLAQGMEPGTSAAPVESAGSIRRRTPEDGECFGCSTSALAFSLMGVCVKARGSACRWAR